MSALPHNHYTANMPPGRRAALQRRNSLAKIAAFRHGQPLTHGHGWALLMANAIEALGEYPNEAALLDLANRIGIKLGDVDITVGLAFRHDRHFGYGPGGRLVSAETAGALLGLTAVEREAAGVIDIDAIDETKAARRKRLDRQRRAKSRAAAGLKPASPKAASVEQQEPWRADGVSRRTWYRQRAKSDGTGIVVLPSSKELVIEHYACAHAHASKNTTNAVPKSKADKPALVKIINVSNDIGSCHPRETSKQPLRPRDTRSATARRGS